MKLYKKFLKRMETDNGYDNEKLAKDLQTIAEKHQYKQLNMYDVSGLACKCGNQIFTHRHSNLIECTACNKIHILQA